MLDNKHNWIRDMFLTSKKSAFSVQYSISNQMLIKACIMYDFVSFNPILLWMLYYLQRFEINKHFFRSCVGLDIQHFFFYFFFLNLCTHLPALIRLCKPHNSLSQRRIFPIILFFTAVSIWEALLLLLFLFPKHLSFSLYFMNKTFFTVVILGSGSALETVEKCVTAAGVTGTNSELIKYLNL